MSAPVPKIGVVSNVFVKQLFFAKAGDIEQGHQHAHDHLSLLASGAVRIKIGEDTTEFTAPHMVFIRADQNHEITALEDGTTMYCIHGLRKEDGTDDMIEPEMIPKGPALRQYLKQIVAQT